jgi:glycerol kinase
LYFFFKNLTMYIVVIDQGTSSTRAILFDLKGQVIKFFSNPLKSYYPKPGWVEQCPEEIWQHTKSLLKKVCLNINPKKILAIGMTNQRETTLCWDKTTGVCLSNAIVWQDRRTQEFCEHLNQEYALIKSKTGLICDAYFSASKLNWLLKYNNLNSLQMQNLAFGTIDSFLLWRLTHGKQHKTDMTNASRTLLYNIYQREWDNDLLNIFNIPKHILPEVCHCNAEFGFLNKEFLGHSIPIRAMIGDQQSALIGIGATMPGDLKVTYGTGGFVMTNTGLDVIESPDLLSTIAYSINNQTHYALEGYINDAGSAIHWLKDTLGLVQDFKEAEILASSVESSYGVCFIPSFSGLGPPHHLVSTGAYFTGLLRSTTKAHLIRAIFESILFQTKDIVQLMQKSTDLQLKSLKVDGGMVHNHWFIKQLAAIIQKPIIIPNLLENTAKGAAMLAYLAIDDGVNIQNLSQSWQNYEIITEQQNIDDLKGYLHWSQEIAHLKK